MTDTFLHGAEVLEISSGSRPIETVATSIIGLIGTAPNSAPEVKASLAVGVVASNNALTFTSLRTGVLGNNTSLRLVNPNANSAALSVTVASGAIVVSLATGSTGAITTTAAQLATAIAANTAAAALVSVAATGASSGAGIVAALGITYLSGGADEPFPLNKPVMVAGSAAQRALLGTGGTLGYALDDIFYQIGAAVIVVRVAVGTSDVDTKANVIGGVNSITGNYEGVQAFLGAQSVTGYRPRILIAPHFTHQTDATVNPVVAALQSVADRLRAVILQDGPNTTDAAAIQCASNSGSARVYLCDPWVLKVAASGDTVQAPPSAFIAGLIAKSDNERGWWWSPSNQEINGIVGTVRPVDFTLGDPNCRANLLNAANVATIIHQNGYRLWGNRSLSSDPKWQFLSVRRTADILNDTVLVNHLWAVDRNIVKTYIADVTDGVNDYMRDLKGLGAILGGKCWADPDLNTPGNITNGHVYFDFDFTPPYPAEHITFRSQLVNDYISEVFN